MTADPRGLARRIIAEEVEREGYRVLRIILFLPMDALNKHEKDVGHIAYDVLKEGVLL